MSRKMFNASLKFVCSLLFTVSITFCMDKKVQNEGAIIPPYVIEALQNAKQEKEVAAAVTRYLAEGGDIEACERISEPIPTLLRRHTRRPAAECPPYTETYTKAPAKKPKTLFAHAVEYRLPTVIELLLERGVDPNEIVAEVPMQLSGVPLSLNRQETALHACAMDKLDVKIASLLLDYGANVNSEPPFNARPLEIAIGQTCRSKDLKKHLSLITLFVERGANIYNDHYWLQRLETAQQRSGVLGIHDCQEKDRYQEIDRYLAQLYEQQTPFYKNQIQVSVYIALKNALNLRLFSAEPILETLLDYIIGPCGATRAKVGWDADRYEKSVEQFQEGYWSCPPDKPCCATDQLKSAIIEENTKRIYHLTDKDQFKVLHKADATGYTPLLFAVYCGKRIATQWLIRPLIETQLLTLDALKDARHLATQRFEQTNRIVFKKIHTLLLETETTLESKIQREKKEKEAEIAKRKEEQLQAESNIKKAIDDSDCASFRTHLKRAAFLAHLNKETFRLTFDNDRTLLMETASQNRTDMVALLLDQKALAELGIGNIALIYERDKDGRTALMIAASAGYPDIVATLVKVMSVEQINATHRGETACQMAKGWFNVFGKEGHGRVMKLIEDAVQGK